MFGWNKSTKPVPTLRRRRSVKVRPHIDLPDLRASYDCLSYLTNVLTYVDVVNPSLLTAEMINIVHDVVRSPPRRPGAPCESPWRILTLIALSATTLSRLRSLTFFSDSHRRIVSALYHSCWDWLGFFICKNPSDFHPAKKRRKKIRRYGVLPKNKIRRLAWRNGVSAKITPHRKSG